MSPHYWGKCPYTTHGDLKPLLLDSDGNSTASQESCLKHHPDWRFRSLRPPDGSTAAALLPSSHPRLSSQRLAARSGTETVQSFLLQSKRLRRLRYVTLKGCEATSKSRNVGIIPGLTPTLNPTIWTASIRLGDSHCRYPWRWPRCARGRRDPPSPSTRAS